MPEAAKHEITLFLVLFKKLMKDDFTLIPRKENLDSITGLGLLPLQVEQIILELTPTEYYRGPRSDISGSGEVWEFGVEIDSTEVYIKLKADVENSIAKCLSFHPSQQEIVYPFKRES